MELKPFLKKVALFILIFATANAIFIGAVYLMANNVSFKLPQNKHVLILGDSHTALAINDKYIPQAVNMSSEGEAYLYSYLKLKKLLAANKQIDTVVISYNFLSIYKLKDKWVTGDDAVSNRIPHYFSYFGKEELEIFLTRPSFYEAALRMPVENKRGFFKLLTGKLKFKDLHLGGYVVNRQNRLEVDLKRRQDLGENEEDFDGYSDYQIRYLNKIVAFCKENKVKLILLNTPIYSKALKFYNTKPYYSFYKKNMNGIPLWDCYNSGYAAEVFRDTEHLNYKGATQFSIFLHEKLSQTQVQANE